MVCIMTLEWIHDWIVIDLVMIYLTNCGEPSMKFGRDSPDFSHPDIGGKEPIECSMKTLQTIKGKRSNKVCNLT